MHKLFMWLLKIEDGLVPFDFSTRRGKICRWVLRNVFTHRYQDAIEIAKLKRQLNTANCDLRHYRMLYMSLLSTYHVHVFGLKDSVYPQVDKDPIEATPNSFCEMDDEVFLQMYEKGVVNA